MKYEIIKLKTKGGDITLEVYHKQKKIAELLMINWDPKYYVIAHLFIDNEHRSEGLGSKLIKRVQKLAKKQIQLQATPETENDRARLNKFYRRHGFKQTSWDLFKWKPTYRTKL